MPNGWSRVPERNPFRVPNVKTTNTLNGAVILFSILFPNNLVLYHELIDQGSQGRGVLKILKVDTNE